MSQREKLNGKWKFHSSTNFENYMKELGKCNITSESANSYITREQDI